jgi:hypothetical protein
MDRTSSSVVARGFSQSIWRFRGRRDVTIYYSRFAYSLFSKHVYPFDVFRDGERRFSYLGVRLVQCAHTYPVYLPLHHLPMLQQPLPGAEHEGTVPGDVITPYKVVALPFLWLHHADDDALRAAMDCTSVSMAARAGTDYKDSDGSFGGHR